MTEQMPPTDADIAAAVERCRPLIRRTPVVESASGDLGLDGGVAIKLESMQYAGSFKARGSLNNALASDIPASGLIAASGGNHGIAVARTARVLGVPAEIFVPSVSAKVKVERIRAQGATVHVTGALYDDAQAACDARAAESGALNIHPYDATHTVAGQATLGVELGEQVPDVDTVVVAVGGGGLVSGIRLALPRTRIVAVETPTCNALHAALVAGRRVSVAPAGVAADALGAKTVGSLPWAVLAGNVDSVLVSDAEAMGARQALWDELQVAVEPAAAVALAAVRSGRYVPAAGERVAVIVCGGNVDPSDLVTG
ncbi:MAG: serine/threonine dehydratase [Acidimicrobiales bacterium]